MLDIFRRHGGQLRMSEALAAGMTRYMLYALRDRGIIELVSRGVYRLAELPPIGNPDLVTVALRVPDAVICLISALAFHGLTTQIPHQVSFALPRSSRIPAIDHPPTEPHRFADAAYRAGVENHLLDGVRVRIYCAEKTLADCFKFRNRIGMDVVLEALRVYRRRKEFNPRELLHYARICRVETVLKPYLEALL